MISELDRNSLVNLMVLVFKLPVIYESLDKAELLNMSINGSSLLHHEVIFIGITGISNVWHDEYRILSFSNL